MSLRLPQGRQANPALGMPGQRQQAVDEGVADLTAERGQRGLTADEIGAGRDVL
jgi:hypothetical protein